MPKAHYTNADFVITHRDEDRAEYGYCRKCTADMQRFKSDGLLRHYHSHTTYRRLNKPIITETRSDINIWLDTTKERKQKTEFVPRLLDGTTLDNAIEAGKCDQL